MIIWTIQPYAVFEKVMTAGAFFCDPQKSRKLTDDGENFLQAYQWMIKEMRQRIGEPPKAGAYPIWAWYRSRDFRHQRPDFRWIRDYANEVCIELELPDKAVLLSDYEGWHFVLNNWYYSAMTGKEQLRQDDLWLAKIPPLERPELKETSWQKIFDITPRLGRDQNGEMVQACFWGLYKSQIRKVWHLQAGKKVSLIYDQSPRIGVK